MSSFTNVLYGAARRLSRLTARLKKKKPPSELDVQSFRHGNRLTLLDCSVRKD